MSSSSIREMKPVIGIYGILRWNNGTNTEHILLHKSDYRFSGDICLISSDNYGMSPNYVIIINNKLPFIKDVFCFLKNIPERETD